MFKNGSVVNSLFGVGGTVMVMWELPDAEPSTYSPRTEKHVFVIVPMVMLPARGCVVEDNGSMHGHDEEFDMKTEPWLLSRGCCHPSSYHRQPRTWQPITRKHMAHGTWQHVNVHSKEENEKEPNCIQTVR